VRVSVHLLTLNATAN